MRIQNWVYAYEIIGHFPCFFQICVVSIVVYSWLRSNYKYCQNIPKYVDQIRKCVTICVPSQTTNELISNVLLPYLFLSEIDLLSEHVVSARKFYQKIIKISLWANKLSVRFDELCHFKTCATCEKFVSSITNSFSYNLLRVGKNVLLFDEFKTLINVIFINPRPETQEKVE